MTETAGNPVRDLSQSADMIMCDGVSKWFGDFQALDGITATIKEQEVVVVLGPSGSGKSTWIRCINKLEHHQEGQIVVDGVELTNDLRSGPFRMKIARSASGDELDAKVVDALPLPAWLGGGTERRNRFFVEGTMQ